jgi:predicted nucleotidyltransferase
MFQQLLARIAEALDGARIRYMVIGGQAVLVYGEPRLTKDIDVTLGVGLDRLDDVVSVVRSLGFEELVDPATFTRETMVLPCQDPDTSIRIDFVLSESGYEQEALARARTIRTGGADVRFAAPEDLVVHKIIAGRARDLEDVRAVLAKNPGIDRDVVAQALEELGRAIEEDLVRRFDEVARDLE